MDAEVSKRLRQAVDFLEQSGCVKNDAAVARRIGVLKSTMSMALNGSRKPTLSMLLDLCDIYPIDFRWLRTGAGVMIKEDREAALLKRIAALEKELKEVRGG